MERFWSKVSFGSDAECWPWLAADNLTHSLSSTTVKSKRSEGDMRSAASPKKELAVEYGVSRPQIHNIVRNKQRTQRGK